MSSRPNSMEVRRNELLSAVQTYAAEAARDFGLATEVADQLGATVADAIATDWGGQVITIPKDYFFRLAKRDMEILNEYRRGVPYAELARQYQLSDRAIRRLLRRAAARGLSNQTDMFGGDTR